MIFLLFFEKNLSQHNLTEIKSAWEKSYVEVFAWNINWIFGRYLKGS